MTIYVNTHTHMYVQSTERLIKCGFLNFIARVWEFSAGWFTCSVLQPNSLSMFRFVFSSVTRLAVAVINSAVVQTPSYRAWPAASSISRRLCLYTSFSLSLSLFLPLLETNDLIYAITLWPPSIITAFCPILYFFFFTPCFIIDREAGWKKLDVSIGVCCFFIYIAIVNPLWKLQG